MDGWMDAWMINDGLIDDCCLMKRVMMMMTMMMTMMMMMMMMMNQPCDCYHSCHDTAVVTFISK